LLFKGEEAKRDFSGEHGRIRRREDSGLALAEVFRRDAVVNE
jgi:hypothetical protein